MAAEKAGATGGDENTPFSGVSANRIAQKGDMRLAFGQAEGRPQAISANLRSEALCGDP
jgi:hypothetical protein